LAKPPRCERQSSSIWAKDLDHQLCKNVHNNGHPSAFARFAFGHASMIPSNSAFKKKMLPTTRQLYRPFCRYRKSVINCLDHAKLLIANLSCIITIIIVIIKEYRSRV
ncbi:hypothetical protein T4E_3123, partial [Trichinella pseudospiralis]